MFKRGPVYYVHVPTPDGRWFQKSSRTGNHTLANAKDDIDWLPPSPKGQKHTPSFWDTRGAFQVARRQCMVLRVSPEGDAWRATVTAGSWAKATQLLRTEAVAKWWCEWTSDRLAADSKPVRRAA